MVVLIVDEFDVGVEEPERYAPVPVDPDRVVPGKVAFEPVGAKGRDGQVVGALGDVEGGEDAQELGTWSAWTPFFVPWRYSFSSPLCRKLTITYLLYRVPLRDTSDGWRSGSSAVYRPLPHFAASRAAPDALYTQKRLPPCSVRAFTHADPFDAAPG